MQHSEQHVLIQATGAGFHALQDTSMKRMQKVAIARKKTDYFRALSQDTAGQRIGAKPQPMDGANRAGVSTLTCGLEFSTREIVPTPTRAARATSTRN